MEVSLKKAGFAVTTAIHGQDALDKVQISPPNLIISDTKMPEMDGFEFCRQVKADERFAPIPFVFLTNQKAVEFKVKGLELGVDDYLTKPIYIKEIVTRVKILLQKKEAQQLDRDAKKEGKGFGGSLADMGVVDLVQTFEIGRKSGTIHIRYADKDAKVYFRDGKVIDAELAKLTGEPAFYRVLNASEGSFEIEFAPVDRLECITASTQGLLMEGMRRLDEWGRMLEQLPPIETVFEVDFKLLAERLAEIPDDVNEILRLFDGKRTIERVVDDCSFEDLASLGIISKLYFEGLVRELSPTSERPAAEAETKPPEVDRWLKVAVPTSPPAAEPLPAPKAEPARLVATSLQGPEESRPSRAATAVRAEIPDARPEPPSASSTWFAPPPATGAAAANVIFFPPKKGAAPHPDADDDAALQAAATAPPDEEPAPVGDAVPSASRSDTGNGRGLDDGSEDGTSSWAPVASWLAPPADRPARPAAPLIPAAAADAPATPPPASPLAILLGDRPAASPPQPNAFGPPRAPPAGVKPFSELIAQAGIEAVGGDGEQPIFGGAAAEAPRTAASPPAVGVVIGRMEAAPGFSAADSAVALDVLVVAPSRGARRFAIALLLLVGGGLGVGGAVYLFAPGTPTAPEGSGVASAEPGATPAPTAAPGAVEAPPAAPPTEAATAATPAVSAPTPAPAPASPMPAAAPGKPVAAAAQPAEPAVARPAPAPTKPAAPVDPEQQYLALMKSAKAKDARGRTVQAAVDYKKALAIKPDSVEALFGAGLALVDTRPKEAIGHLETGLARNASNCRAMVGLGMALQGIAKNAAAADWYKKYLLCAPAGEYADEIRAILKTLK